MRVARRSWQEYYKGQSTTEWKLRGAALDDAIKKALDTIKQTAASKYVDALSGVEGSFEKNW